MQGLYTVWIPLLSKDETWTASNDCLLKYLQFTLCVLIFPSLINYQIDIAILVTIMTISKLDQRSPFPDTCHIVRLTPHTNIIQRITRDSNRIDLIVRLELARQWDLSTNCQRSIRRRGLNSLQRRQASVHGKLQLHVCLGGQHLGHG